MCAPARTDTQVRPYSKLSCSGVSNDDHESLACAGTGWNPVPQKFSLLIFPNRRNINKLSWFTEFRLAVPTLIIDPRRLSGGGGAGGEKKAGGHSPGLPSRAGNLSLRQKVQGSRFKEEYALHLKIAGGTPALFIGLREPKAHERLPSQSAAARQRVHPGLGLPGWGWPTCSFSCRPFSGPTSENPRPCTRFFRLWSNPPGPRHNYPGTHTPWLGRNTPRHNWGSA